MIPRPYNGENTLVITPEPLTEEEREDQEDQETFEAEQKFDRIKLNRFDKPKEQ